MKQAAHIMITGVDGLEGIPNIDSYKLVMLEEKDNGKMFYRKLIANKKHVYRLENGKKLNVLKSSGAWMHEDTMAAKWVNKHKHIIIVVNESGIDCYAYEIFIPGMGWKRPYELREISKLNLGMK
ncbi:MAG: Unknown protein [uncultured Sulfurovum sp.]|uniref:Uncharacterized protein n=1 Tax=uncultured Sulfurovum sp. TaxID=269237 RepID=A0A6S6SK16_9BACT|nr:MAG: Unknown protein [uncultured Sulfurovum sp.]